jgi:hypothetical protein
MIHLMTHDPFQAESNKVTVARAEHYQLSVNALTRAPSEGPQE